MAWLLPPLCLASVAAGWLWPEPLPEERVRLTAKIALLWAILGAGLLPRPSTPTARLVWTLAWAAYLAHVAAAFHFAHGWSHAEAVAHVEARSGFGQGIWFSHLFSILWTADVAWWWLDPAARDARPVWLSSLLFGYMAFITFNATVVYGESTRFMGVVLFLTAGASAWLEWRSARAKDGAT
jgi:hypothetical protein